MLEVSRSQSLSHRQPLRHLSHWGRLQGRQRRRSRHSRHWSQELHSGRRQQSEPRLQLLQCLGSVKPLSGRSRYSFCPLGDKLPSVFTSVREPDVINWIREIATSDLVISRRGEGETWEIIVSEHSPLQISPHLFGGSSTKLLKHFGTGC